MGGGIFSFTTAVRQQAHDSPPVVDVGGEVSRSGRGMGVQGMIPWRAWREEQAIFVS